MLKVTRRRHGINFIDCWYAEQPIRDKGIIQYWEAAFSQTGSQREEFPTLFSDLTETEEEIVAHFSKNCRYEVRRAPKEGVQTRMVTGKEALDSGLIDQFVEFFDEFWKSKGTCLEEKEKCREQLKRYAAQNAFAISVASLGEKPLVYHTYILEGNITRLYQSASQFRTDETISQQLIGYANRYLHKEDMLWFKEKNYRTYDWGGAGTGEEVASITKFKESFGGDHRLFYNGQTVNGLWPGLYSRLIRLLSKF